MSSIHLLYFSWLQEKVGKAEENILLAELKLAAPCSVKDVLRKLSENDTAYEGAFSDLKALKVAINQEYASFNDPINDGDEVAIFPPATGG